MNRRACGSLGVLLLSAGIACGSYSATERPERGAGTGGSAGTAALPSSGAGGSSASAGSGGGGAAGSVGGGGQAGSSGGGGSAGVGGALAEQCPTAPAPRLAAGTVLELPIELTFRGAPLLFAEANPVREGGTLTPLDLRFYVSNVALLRDGAEPVPVDIVTSTQAVAPYGVHLFNAEDATSATVRVLAPAGEYGGITFLWGLEQSCNRLDAEGNVAPLSATSRMSWPHTGFLFFRYEGRYAFPTVQGSAGAGGASLGGAGGTSAGGMGAGGVSAGGVSAGGVSAGGVSAGGVSAGGMGAGVVNPLTIYPRVVHMGGNLEEALAPAIRVQGHVSVPAVGPVQKGLRVAMEEIFKGAFADVDLTGFVPPHADPGEEIIRGERLRRSLPSLTVFSFAP
jgi:hypothetical protein